MSLSTTQQQEDIQVGSIVRVHRPDTKNLTGRAMIATIQSNNNNNNTNTNNDGTTENVELETLSTTCCLFWEPIAPKPINVPINVSKKQSQQTKNKPFLITPFLHNSNTKHTDIPETTIPIQHVQRLLSFEENNCNQNLTTTTTSTSDDSNTSTNSNSIDEWKSRGDQLLKLGDGSTASSYYEIALQLTNNISIGSEIIIKRNGYPRIAEIDCIDDDDNTFDITLIRSTTDDDDDDDDEEEITISQSDILLCIQNPDSNKLQERILLNLARCMLQLSDIDIKYKSKYLNASILACTLASTIVDFHNNNKQQCQEDQSTTNTSLPTNKETALILRSNSYMGLLKWQLATADAKKLIKKGNNKSSGEKLLTKIQQKQKYHTKTDKKLAKEVCKWVQTATTQSNEEEHDRNQKQEPLSPSQKQSTTSSAPSNKSNSNVSSSWLPYLVVLLVAILIKKILIK